MKRNSGTVSGSLLFIIALGLTATLSSFSFGATPMYFQRNEAEKQLELAIDRDDPAEIAAAIKKGVDVNVAGTRGVTPLLMAVGKMRAAAVAELLRNGAKSGIRDKSGDTAVTLAVNAYKSAPHFLEILLRAGADPDTLRSDGDPIIVDFFDAHDLNAARYLHAAGASIDVRDRSNRPLVMRYALSQDWDSVYTLLSLGAKFDYPNEPITWREIFSRPGITPPDSPLWPYKVKVWRILREHGQPVPAKIDDLVAPKFWEYLKKKGLPRPVLE